jgi:hypothetical protein
MAGYDYAAGMSNSAVDAYVAGRKPLSRLTLTDLRVAGWKETKKLAIALADSGLWRSAEWHHSGGSFYNEIDFFDPDDLVDFWESCDDRRKSELQDTARNGAAGSKWEVCSGVRVKGSFTVWGGSRRSPRRIGTEAFEGVLRGKWIHLDAGGKKKADGNHISFSEI